MQKFTNTRISCCRSIRKRAIIAQVMEVLGARLQQAWVVRAYLGCRDRWYRAKDRVWERVAKVRLREARKRCSTTGAKDDSSIDKGLHKLA